MDVVDGCLLKELHAWWTILMCCGKTLPERISVQITQYVDCLNQEPAHFQILRKVQWSADQYFKYSCPASRFVDSVLSPYIPTVKSALNDSTELVNTLTEMIGDPV